MRKILLFSLSILCFCAARSQNRCDQTGAMVTYQDKAPFSIDGQTSDWQSILGPVGAYTYFGSSTPYQPPLSSASNWIIDRTISLDPIQNVLVLEDRDKPSPQSDIHFMAFTHDDYNVYFYLRRQAVSNDPNTFYYFIDINNDGLMNSGEPVIHATLINNTVSALTLSRYVVNTSLAYNTLKQGNLMRRDDLSVDNFPLAGSLVEVFNSEKIIPNEKPKKNEVFQVAITEEGMGVELAIPWSYLKNWIVVQDKDMPSKDKYEKTTPLSPGELFFYRTAMQPTTATYSRQSVVDNAASCHYGTGNPTNDLLSYTFEKKNLVKGSKYQFNITYTNNTNFISEVNTRGTITFKKTSDLPLSGSDFIIEYIMDNNCNGMADPGETPLSATRSSPVYDPLSDSFKLSFNTTLFQTIMPYGTVCLIVQITLPSNGTVKAFRIQFDYFARFNQPPCPPSPYQCIPVPGRPINQVGFADAEIPMEDFSFEISKKTTLSESQLNQEDYLTKNIVIYPNPSKGATNIYLPVVADVIVTDAMGRTVQTINKAQAGIMPLKNLTPGFYMVKLRPLGTERLITKKLAVQ